MAFFFTINSARLKMAPGKPWVRHSVNRCCDREWVFQALGQPGRDAPGLLDAQRPQLLFNGHRLRPFRLGGQMRRQLPRQAACRLPPQRRLRPPGNGGKFPRRRAASISRRTHGIKRGLAPGG